MVIRICTDAEYSIILTHRQYITDSQTSLRGLIALGGFTPQPDHTFIILDVVFKEDGDSLPNAYTSPDAT